MASTPATSGPLRYLALGDSYTIGEGVEADECWPAQLARSLQAQGWALADPEIVATTGWTTDELSAAMDAHAFAPPYALVSLLIGVNNQYRGRDLAGYRADLARLLARAFTLAGADASRVLVVSIPDWGITRFAREHGHDAATIAAAIDAFNAAARALALDQRVPFVDITSASREAADRAGMLVADGLHPSAAQYARWTDVIVQCADSALGAGPR